MERAERRVKKQKLINSLASRSQVGSGEFDKDKVEIFSLTLEEIECAVDRLTDAMQISTNSQDALARKVFWLNVILTGATVVATLVSILALIRH